MKKTLKFIAILAVVYLVVRISPVLTFHPERNPRPLPPSYKKGAFHIHSLFSDGRGSIDEIAAGAARCGLDFIILTDHGRPNLPASASTQWLDETLIIGASEFSLNGGHMVAAGYRVPDYIFPPEPQEAIDEVNRDGGVTFISHPLDRKIPWTDWSATRFSGIEVLSAYTSARNNPLQTLLVFPWQYLFNPDCAITDLFRYPERELAIWDRLNRGGAYSGIYALDAHAKLQISRGLRFRFPSYAAMFRILAIYAKVDGEFSPSAPESASKVISALKKGNFFNVIESLAPANGFENHYKPRSGPVAEMGGSSDLYPGDLVLKLPFPFPTDIVVKKDGNAFQKIVRNSRSEVRIAISQPGVYRSEIFLSRSRFARLPWILANPFFIGCGPRSPEPSPALPDPSFPLPEREFQIEKNRASQAAASAESEGNGKPVTVLDFTLNRDSPETVDSWVALALRKPIDLSGFRGLVFDSRGDSRMRMWAQFRTRCKRGEDAYQHSFPVDRDWTRTALPFSRFHHLFGNDDTMHLSDANAVFFIIDSNNAFTGKKGNIWLRNIGLY